MDCMEICMAFHAADMQTYEQGFGSHGLLTEYKAHDLIKVSNNYYNIRGLPIMAMTREQFLEKKKARNKKYEHPYLKQMKSVAQAKYEAKVCERWGKVFELEAKYEELKQKLAEWRMQNGNK